VNGTIIQDEAYAWELYTKGAQLGHPPAQFKLGYCYENKCLGCNIDPRKSIAWYSRAAEQGEPEAELALSGWYLTGAEGILPQSDQEAFLWAQRAAEKGLAKAEYALGYYFETGVGTACNLSEAKRWYLMAAEQGQKRAMARLAELKKMPNGGGGVGSSGRKRELQRQRGGGGGGKED
jgi:TPR repeat protein